MKKYLAMIVLMLVFSLVGCRADPVELTLDDVNVDIAVDSEQPAVGIVDMLVTVTATEGEPIIDATVSVYATMTHAGMVPFESEPVTENEDGVYRVPVEFSMGGDWVFDVTVELANGEITVVEYALDGVEGDGMDMDDMDMESDDEDMGDMEMDSDDEDMGDMEMDGMGMMSGAVTGAYVTITNDTDNEVILIGASADGIGTIELHETTVDENDVASMVEQEDGILVDSGETVNLMPGGLHLMLLNVENSLEMDDVLAITLEFDSGMIITADFVASMAPVSGDVVEMNGITLTDYWVRPVAVMDDESESEE